MARISRVKRNSRADEERTKACAALFLLLITLDGYCLSKVNEKEVSLRVFIEIFSNEFKAKDELGLIKPLGDWLCSLPKGIWDNKKNYSNNKENDNSN
ncbi:putative xylose isomerase-like sugar epimerase [Dysgonomonadaceae bacterium PH5-43]|nr:putative xylose isomerase-like sugar epimerase [Dysgonomonadaceae bacterium PH5-43]